MFPLLNDFAASRLRLVANYDDTRSKARTGSGLMRAVLTKRLNLRGFIVSDSPTRLATSIAT